MSLYMNRHAYKCRPWVCDWRIVCLWVCLWLSMTVNKCVCLPLHLRVLSMSFNRCACLPLCLRVLSMSVNRCVCLPLCLKSFVYKCVHECEWIYGCECYCLQECVCECVCEPLSRGRLVASQTIKCNSYLLDYLVSFMKRKYRDTLKLF
jgi:hypothetical protein